MRGFDSPAICGDAKSTIYGTDGDRIGRMDATQRDYRVGIYTGAAHKARMAMDSVSVGRFQQSGVRGLLKTGRFDRGGKESGYGLYGLRVGTAT